MCQLVVLLGCYVAKLIFYYNIILIYKKYVVTADTMPRQYVRPVGCRSYKNYTEETLQKVLDEIRSKSISVRAAAEKYGVHRNTLSSKLKGKAPRKPGGQTVFSEHEERAFISKSGKNQETSGNGLINAI